MSYLPVIFIFILISCSSVRTISVDKVQEISQSFKSKVDFLSLEKTPEEISKNIDVAIKKADEALEKLIKIPKSRRNFENTIGVLDEIFFNFDKVANRHYFMNSVSPEKSLRDEATKSIGKINRWYNGVFFREGLYKAFREYELSSPKFSSKEDEKLFIDLKRTFRKNGFHLSRSKRELLKKIRNKLSQASTDFSNNIRDFKNIIRFSSVELDGLPNSALNTLKRDKEGNYLMDSRITSDYLTIVKYAKSEVTRKKALMARSTVAKKKNAPLMEKLVRLRNQLARTLGYKNYSDLATEDKMVKTGNNAVKFITDLSKGLESKFQEEQKLLTELKRKDTGREGKLKSWDGAYYERLYLQNKFHIDPEKIKEYFPMEKVLKGMFSIYEKIFGIRFREVQAEKWVDDVKVYVGFDQKTGEPLGTLYLDLYPRDGKYTHFAQFGVLPGKTLRDGLKQRPIGVLVCNFPRPLAGKPSLLSYDHVETLFHEFGHGMHNILSKTKYANDHGTSVPRDFVEAPSQMLEFWVRDKDVLDTFAAHYKTGEKLPKVLLDNLFASQKAFIARLTRGQIAYAMTDLNLHTRAYIPSGFDIVKETNETIGRYYMPRPKGSSFITSFGHLAGGYASGYYGYQWSLAIASDMARKFKNAPGRFFDKSIGMKLRKEIYEVGDSRDVNLSIEKFLGRKWSLQAYLDELGISH